MAQSSWRPKAPAAASDNGASSEGGPDGSLNDGRMWNLVEREAAEAIERIDEIEFIAGLYMHDTLGPVIPGANVDRMMVDAATRTKAGKKAKLGMQASEDYFALAYDGPRTVKELLADKRFQFRKSIKQGQARIMRVRPWFHGWTLDVAIEYDEKIFDKDDMVAMMHTAGRYIGLGDWRPRFGRFDAKAK